MFFCPTFRLDRKSGQTPLNKVVYYLRAYATEVSNSNLTPSSGVKTVNCLCLTFCFWLSICLSCMSCLSDILLRFWTTFVLITKLKSLSAFLSVCLSVFLSTCLPIFLTSCWHSEQLLFWQLSWKVFLSVGRFVCRSVCLSVGLNSFYFILFSNYVSPSSSFWLPCSPISPDVQGGRRTDRQKDR